MSGLDLIAFIASVASLILTVGAIWLSIVFFRMSTVEDMRKHIWNKPNELQGNEMMGAAMQHIGGKAQGLLPRSAFEILLLCIGLNLLIQPVAAQVSSPKTIEIQPPICSATTVAEGVAPKGICTVTALGNGHNEVKIDLTAQTAPIDVAGYKVTTDNYNGDYLTPIVEAQPGDTVAAHIVNILEPRTHDGATPGEHDKNPTNLHYFHGGIVSPNNARPKNAELGDGDNVYVYLRTGKDALGQPNSFFDLNVRIPGGEDKLDARVLEGTGLISHPVGLNWYHSHLHGISSTQVMGGMSGLLSVGDATANVKAACDKSPTDNSKCLNDVIHETADLKQRTKVKYVLLRDMSLKDITKRPEEPGSGTAKWDPMNRDFPPGKTCGVWDGSKLNNDDPKLRLGFCQRDEKTAWLFTLNGQRFPTFTVEGGQNLLVRMGNVSSNTGYLLELYNEADGTVLPLKVLSLDGVVPARPVTPDQANKPVEANDLDDLLLMPASRVEFYVRNDEIPHQVDQVYVLRTKGLKHIGKDEWPEIQLARIVLKPHADKSDVKMGLNAAIAEAAPISTRMWDLMAGAVEVLLPEEKEPEGCVRDLDPAQHEFRRVIFLTGGQTTSGRQTEWSIKTEIVKPEMGPLKDEEEYIPADAALTSITDSDGNGVPFEEYELPDGTVNWIKPKHVCIKMDHGSHEGSHKQLWVLYNATTTLHNFHIHQMKFRLATRSELENDYHISPPDPNKTCGKNLNLYKCFDDVGMSPGDPKTTPIFWHDTIPVPPGSKVFVVMSYDAKEQIGRFVFHCHILKHEDNGLMAPIEVWEP